MLLLSFRDPSVVATRFDVSFQLKSLGTVSLFNLSIPSSIVLCSTQSSVFIVPFNHSPSRS